MKRNIKNMAFALLTLFAVTSCDLLEIDNYDGPNATIEGKILDIETGELVEQDIIDGAQIEFIEHGFENPETQYMVIKNNGTYRNNVMFAGSYTMSLMRGNFVSVKDQEVVVKGNTVYDFRVQPYIRIKNASIQKNGSKVVAKFRLEKTVDQEVAEVALYGHRDPNVGEPLKEFVVKQGVDNSYLGNEFTLELDLKHENIKSGTQYYFRIGARINIGGAKFNYVPAVRLAL